MELRVIEVLGGLELGVGGFCELGFEVGFVAMTGAAFYDVEFRLDCVECWFSVCWSAEIESSFVPCFRVVLSGVVIGYGCFWGVFLFVKWGWSEWSCDERLWSALLMFGSDFFDCPHPLCCVFVLALRSPALVLIGVGASCLYRELRMSESCVGQRRMLYVLLELVDRVYSACDLCAALVVVMSWVFGLMGLLTRELAVFGGVCLCPECGFLGDWMWLELSLVMLFFLLMSFGVEAVDPCEYSLMMIVRFGI
ncbi:hypothetical protein Tco_1338734 [Tanacetum coccineum]